MTRNNTDSLILKDFTLIIPTFNRYDFLFRLLNYYKTKNSPITFLILDSSEKEVMKLNIKNCNLLGNQFIHIAFPSSITVASKLLSGIKSVKTNYCAFCADDDIIFTDGLEKALNYIEKHNDIVCVDGIYLRFEKMEKEVLLSAEYHSLGITAQNPCARIFKLFQKYESLYYGVFRTQDALAIFSRLHKIKTLHYQELFQAAAALILGKIHRLPFIYAARQNCLSADLSRDKWQTYYWFCEDSKEILDHYIDYRNELWEFYSNYGAEIKMQQKDFFKAMDISHAVYFSSNCPQDYLYSQLQEYWPEDLFQKIEMYKDNIYPILKNNQNPSLILIKKFINKIKNKIIILSSKIPLRNTNQNLLRSNTEINCVLNAGQEWVIAIENYSNIYNEICLYYSW